VNETTGVRPVEFACSICAPRAGRRRRSTYNFESQRRVASSGPFTLKKLTEVDDSAPRFGYAEHQEARFATKDLEAEQTGLSHHRVKPGKRQGFAHKHEDAEEIYVVVAGSGRVKLDDEIVDIEALDAIRVSPEVTRQFEGGPEGLELIAFGPRHEGDGDIIPGWWSD
jgi:mannose-6-phosphate isomerase-like protein (cupin superfamily)